MATAAGRDFTIMLYFRGQKRCIVELIVEMSQLKKIMPIVICFIRQNGLFFIHLNGRGHYILPRLS